MLLGRQRLAAPIGRQRMAAPSFIELSQKADKTRPVHRAWKTHALSCLHRLIIKRSYALIYWLVLYNPTAAGLRLVSKWHEGTHTHRQAGRQAGKSHSDMRTPQEAIKWCRILYANALFAKLLPKWIISGFRT